MWNRAEFSCRGSWDLWANRSFPILQILSAVVVVPCLLKAAAELPTPLSRAKVLSIFY